MAQTRQAAPGDKSAPAPAGKSSNGAAPASDSSALSGRFNLANLGRLFAPRPAATSANGQPTKRQGFGKLLFAFLIFIVAAQVGNYALFFLAQRFPQWNLLTGTVVPKNALPILDSVTRYEFMYVIFIVALYIALYRFNVFPKDPFGNKARIQQQRDAAAASRTSSGAGPGTRAERRHATRHATTTTTSTAKAPSARQVAAQARATTPARTEGANDSEYERVKAAQRQRRRRETKR